MKHLLAIATLVLFCSCAVTHKVAVGVGHGAEAVGRAVASEFRLPYSTPCNPTPGEFQRYACETYGMCSGWAALMQISEDPEDIVIISDSRPFKVTGIKRRECAYDGIAFKIWACPRVTK